MCMCVCVPAPVLGTDPRVLHRIVLTTELQPWPELAILLPQFQEDRCTTDPFLLYVPGPETEVRLLRNCFPARFLKQDSPQAPSSLLGQAASGIPSAGIAGPHQHTWPMTGFYSFLRSQGLCGRGQRQPPALQASPSSVTVDPALALLLQTALGAAPA